MHSCVVDMREKMPGKARGVIFYRFGIYYY